MREATLTLDDEHAMVLMHEKLNERKALLAARRAEWLSTTKKLNRWLEVVDSMQRKSQTETLKITASPG